MEPRDPMGGDANRAKNDLKDAARGIAQQARETTGRLSGRAREQAGRLVDERKDRAAHTLDSLSGALRDSAGRLRGEQSFFGDYAESAAGRVEDLARYLREGDPERFVRDAEDFARRRPEIFVGGAFVAGLLVARFLKSSAQRSYVPRGDSGARSGSRPDDGDQPEFGSYAGSPGLGASGVGLGATGSYNPRPQTGASIAPDDESDLGL